MYQKCIICSHNQIARKHHQLFTIDELHGKYTYINIESQSIIRFLGRNIAMAEFPQSCHNVYLLPFPNQLEGCVWDCLGGCIGMWVLNGLNQPQHTGPKKSVQSPTNYNLTVAFVLGTKNLFRSIFPIWRILVCLPLLPVSLRHNNLHHL